MHAFRGIQRKPFAEGKLVEQARLTLQQQPAAIALRDIFDRQFLALPVGEAFHHVAIERVGDVVGRERGVVSRLHYTSRCTTRFGCACIRRFHSLMYSRMKASSVAGAVTTPFSSVCTRPGTSSPRSM